MKPSLSQSYPQLAEEWSDKNLPLRPTDVTYGSNKVVWWKGTCGHEWQAKIKYRSSGEGCPYCVGKRVLKGFNDLESKYPEVAEEWSDKNDDSPDNYTDSSHKKVWWKGKCGHEWQAIIRNRVAGAGCPYCSGNSVLKGVSDLKTVAPKLAVEWSENNIDIKPDKVLPNCNKKVWWRCNEGHEWKARISDRYRGSGCPYCSGKVLIRGFNDLATTNPELIEEWEESNTKNIYEVRAGSRQKVLWKCWNCGFVWRASPYERVNGNDCPVCSKGILYEGVNDLIQTHPDIASLWHKYRNESLAPNKVTSTSVKTVWWNGVCGHEWHMRVCDMVNTDGRCPTCMKRFEQVKDLFIYKYYIESEGWELSIKDSNIIGLPLDIYIPEMSVAIIIHLSDLHERSLKKDNVINTLCERSGIRLIRVITPRDRDYSDCISIRREDESIESFEEALSEIINALGGAPDINIERDLCKIRDKYLTECTSSMKKIYKNMDLGP